MVLEPVRAQVLATRIIANVDGALARQFRLSPRHRSIGMLTVTIDDVGYTAVDEATKRAEVDVVYAKSFYAGSAHSSGPLSGEFIGVLAGPTPDEVRSGLEAAAQVVDRGACFYALDAKGEHTVYPHVISRTGRYLSKVAGIVEGEPLAYLIAPPLEAMFGLDAALKAATVRLAKFYGPPTETNFAGGLLTGSQSACTAAAAAFLEAVVAVAESPLAVR
ncbi:ethanolamine utilization microcompartment protein EutL [Kyrpidia spormannii]|uniref:Putative carboxysome-related structural protein with putative role in ethanolamine utilization n=1 Tax=Kyrpidia spormannii TaxID=2055160 RepID=A0A6F9EEJ4_9BACL|nr:ethanolamine utilization microcompartment protein EutL [Kyrpidia spormannii]CAB3395299.1 putative carboxysome-related structural protein with putative role in ethanolamine utilization [Kyrpidia spormannii]